MELLQIRQFKAIAEIGNMTKAAENLHVSQPTLSAMLKRLEGELGLNLFVREKNRLHLTEAGHILLHHASILLEAEQNALDALERFKRRETELRVGFCDPGPMWYYYPRYSMTKPQKEMKAEVYLDLTHQISSLIDRTYDILISYGPVEHPELESTPMVHEYFMLSVAKNSPLANRSSICIREEKIPVILLLYVDGAFFAGQRTFWAELEPDTRLEQCADFFLYQQQTRNTDIPTLSTFLSRNYRDDGDHRVLIPVTDPELSVDYHLTYLKSRRKELKPFCDWIKKA